MLDRDTIRRRLDGEGISYTEFSYMLLQANDYVELHQRHGCSLQIGGSDQWGNIVMGIDLHRRIEAERRFQPMKMEKKEGSVMKATTVQPMIQTKRDDEKDYSTESFMNFMNSDGTKDLYGLTTPLLTTSAGAKMGKTANGAVWLNKDMLSAYDYWQFWRNVEDADVGRFLRLFTELPLDEIVKLEALKGAEINEAKKILASEATKLLHGDAAAVQAADTAKQTFEEGTIGADIPVVEIDAKALEKGIAAHELLRLAGLATSGGEARRLIRGGGARAADQKIEDENAVITPEMFAKDKTLKLSSGKKKHVLVKLT
jgi:tyrosyl-tRNA synthetase